MPTGWADYDVLYFTARDPHGREIYTWSWLISSPEQVANRLMAKGQGPVAARDEADQLTWSRAV